MKVALPGCCATSVQLPALFNVAVAELNPKFRVLADTLQTLGVDVLTVTVRPEDAVAVITKGESVTVLLGIAPKLMDWVTVQALKKILTQKR